MSPAHVLWCATLLTLAQPASEPSEPAGKNRLGKETSPYLKLHADNPVHWYAWGPEALAEAQRQNKPIFLSIGYSSCHWCHVMNRESFADPKIAATLNDRFICVKVDREERPDVDQLYMDAVQAMTGHGGWPLSVFLLPDGRPFAGGTYFPPADRKDDKGEVVMTGFPTVLDRVVTFYTERRGDLEKQGDAISDLLRRTATTPRLDATPLSPKLVLEAAVAIANKFDPEYAGLSPPPRFAPKFPQPSIGLFLMEVAQGGKQSALLEPLVQQAEAMARGGIFDQVGGGFHRYSVDRKWIVPHFEKMLYDQAQLLSFYSKLQRQRPNPLYRRVVAETVAFVEREMTSPEGLFFSALDADSEHEEGKFYVWTPDEIRQVLGPDADWVLAMTGADKEANFEGKWILVARRTPAEMAKTLGISEADLLKKWEGAKSKLLAERAKRVRPLLDTKAITSWNALMIVGLADAAAAFEEPKYRSLALTAADRLLALLRTSDGKLVHQRIEGQSKGAAFADDYAASILALLAAYRLDPQSVYLETAQQFAKTLQEEFWDPAGKGYFYTGAKQEALVVRSKEMSDGAFPSSNSLAALALVELAEQTKDNAYRATARQVIEAAGSRLGEDAAGSTTMLRALHLLFEGEPAPAIAAVAAQKRGKIDPINKVEIVPEKLTFRGTAPVKFTVKIAVNAPWHINANPASPKYVKPTVVKLIGSDAIKLNKVEYPKGEPLEIAGLEDPVMVYSGTVEITGEASLTNATAGSTEVTLQVDYQACDDQKCLAPTKIKLTVPVVVEGSK